MRPGRLEEQGPDPGQGWARGRPPALVLQLKTDLQHREEALRQQQAEAREKPDSDANVGRELQGVFLGPSL